MSILFGHVSDWKTHQDKSECIYSRLKDVNEVGSDDANSGKVAIDAHHKDNPHSLYIQLCKGVDKTRLPLLLFNFPEKWRF